MTLVQCVIFVHCVTLVRCDTGAVCDTDNGAINHGIQTDMTCQAISELKSENMARMAERFTIDLRLENVCGIA